ncbi:hypothetical protein PYW07_014594 [Mythimna separata]|uniref:Uncharacterized protein n=1 Tax=Mythimna separata TaxID=271217 RepID=A0AAD7Z079_MYTSE|nr:hypothetical protein PYW07_014594 [Mythimna separata]
MNPQAIKCHKCRHILFDDTCIQDSSLTCDPKKCESYDIKRFIYVSEDKVPAWIKEKIENEDWTKGKLHCQKCNNRIGSFDYISGRKCNCGSSVIPPIHLVTSQIDRPMQIQNIIR